MADTAPRPESPSPAPDRSRRRFFRRAALGALIASVATGIGFTAMAEGGRGWGHHRGFMGTHLDPARLDEGLGRLLQHLYVEIDATDAQKQQLDPIIRSAAKDLLPIRAELHDTRRQALAVLSRDPVDRPALEALRAAQLARAEAASKRLTEALADIAEVLTPTQRQELAERFERRHRWHGARG